VLARDLRVTWLIDYWAQSTSKKCPIPTSVYCQRPKSYRVLEHGMSEADVSWVLELWSLCGTRLIKSMSISLTYQVERTVENRQLGNLPSWSKLWSTLVPCWRELDRRIVVAVWDEVDQRPGVDVHLTEVSRWKNGGKSLAWQPPEMWLIEIMEHICLVLMRAVSEYCGRCVVGRGWSNSRNQSRHLSPRSVQMKELWKQDSSWTCRRGWSKTVVSSRRRRPTSSRTVLVVRVLGKMKLSQPLRFVDERSTFDVRQLFPRSWNTETRGRYSVCCFHERGTLNGVWCTTAHLTVAIFKVLP